MKSYPEFSTVLLKAILIALFVLIQIQIYAQSAPNYVPRYNYSNQATWISITGSAKMNKKFDAYTDLQIRQAEYGTAPMQYMIRPGILYNYNEQLALGIGYLYNITFKYGEIPQTKYTFPEHRIWEQLVLKNKIGKVDITQRLRMEHRWIGEVQANMDVIRYRYQDRFRYMLRATLPLNKPSIEKGVLYVCAYDELMISFGKKVGGNVYDQNRLFLGLGYHLGIMGRIELGYLYQNLMQRNIWYPNGKSLESSGYYVFENNHTLLLAYTFKLDFSNKSD